MQNDVKDFLEPTERAAEGDENSATFQFWHEKSVMFVAVVTTLRGFKTHRRSKGKSLKTNGQLDVDLIYRS